MTSSKYLMRSSWVTSTSPATFTKSQNYSQNISGFCRQLLVIFAFGSLLHAAKAWNCFSVNSAVALRTSGLFLGASNHAHHHTTNPVFCTGVCTGLSFSAKILLQERGLEPLHLSVQAPKTCASANSATPAAIVPITRDLFPLVKQRHPLQNDTRRNPCPAC